MIATVKNAAKCVSSNDSYSGFFVRDCPTMKKEKAFLKVKYEKSLNFTEARIIVEEQLATASKSYASITQGAGVHGTCTDVQTQTDETCIAKLESASSADEGKQIIASEPPASRMAQIVTDAVQRLQYTPNWLK